MRQRITVFGFFSEDNGLTTYFKTNYRALLADGYQFNIINIASYRPARELKRFGNYYEIPFYISDVNNRNFLKKRREFNRKLKTAYEECHLSSETIHFYLSNACDPVPITLAHKVGFQRIITHAYSGYSRVFNFVQMELQRIGMKTIEKYATDYIAVSKETANFFYFKRIQKKAHFKILKSGIPVRKQRFHEEQNIYYRKRYNIEESDFVIGNIGRFIPSKNQIFLVESFNLFQKIYPNTKLVLIGDGPLIEDVRQRAYDLHLENKVIFTGFLENSEEVQNIFNVFAYPSLADGLSLSLIHSIANGATAVMADSQSAELSTIGDSMILSISDPQVWADAFHRLSQEKYNRIEESQNAMDELITHGYTVATSTRELKKLYGQSKWESQF